MTTTPNDLSRLVMIDGFLIDVALNEEYTFDSDVTDFPVESGSSIVDNIRPKPVVVRIEGVVSNTPFGNVAQARQNAGNGGTLPVNDAYDLLLKVRDAREPVTISTTMRIYENMALQSLSMPRSSGRGDELRFNATFKQVTIITNKRTTRVATPGGVSNHTRSGVPYTVTTSPVKVYLLQEDQDPEDRDQRYVWYDETYRFWRDVVVHQEGKWNCFRDKPYGITTSDYVNNKMSDSQYSQFIASETHAGRGAAYNPLVQNIPTQDTNHILDGQPGDYQVSNSFLAFHIRPVGRTKVVQATITSTPAIVNTGTGSG